MKFKTFVVLAIGLMIPAAALAEVPSHTFRGHLDWVSPTGDTKIEGEKVEADDAFGFGLGYEYQFTDLMGVDFNLLWANHDAKSGSETLGDTTVTPLTVGLNFHLSKNDKFDFFLGPLVGYVMYDDISVKDEFGGGDIKLKNDFGYGLQLGLDVPFNENWAFTAGLIYLQTKAEIDEDVAGHDGGMETASSDNTDEIDINPWILRAGLAYKF